jgi:hypothetical protein
MDTSSGFVILKVFKIRVIYQRKMLAQVLADRISELEF